MKPKPPKGSTRAMRAEMAKMASEPRVRAGARMVRENLEVFGAGSEASRNAKSSKPLRKTKPPVAVRASVRIRAYSVISGALDSVGRCAVYSALKHRDESLPEDAIEAINEQVHRETMAVLCDLLHFGDGDE